MKRVADRVAVASSSQPQGMQAETSITNSSIGQYRWPI